MQKKEYVRWLDELGGEDVPLVGGKNASLGEMIRELEQAGIQVPGGFATTAEAYREYIRENGLQDRIREQLDMMHGGEQDLARTGKNIRMLIREGEFPRDMEEAIRDAYRQLCERYDRDEVDVAVRSSATAEDLPEASFAGQQETFLNVTGPGELLESCVRCFASLFTDRAISYREEQGFHHLEIALSVGVQKMVRADLAGSGVMFSIDTETGFRDAVVINAAWGLGENVVQGAVTPDEYLVFKPLLDREHYRPIIAKSLGEKEKKMVYATGGSHTVKNMDTTRRERASFVLDDEEILTLGRWAAAIERHYGRPMDIEWAKDGEMDRLFVVQARPETVQSQKEAGTLKSYRLKKRGSRLVEGLAIGQSISSGRVQVIKSPDEMDRFEEGSVLVTGMTDPDWVPVMKKASAIVTDHGGRTSHAAIVSRELGVTAVVGTDEATRTLSDGQEVTVSCAEGDQGYIYEGLLDYEEKELDLAEVPETRTRIMMNIASPAAAFRWWRLPCRGIGLARMEFIVNTIIKIHPMALVRFEKIQDEGVRRRIDGLTRGYPNREEYFVDQLSMGIARIAAAQYPEPVVVRMSDFKTNEYANLIGGSFFEPEEENPMLGFRGASRYYSDRYREGFALECRAIKRVRDRIGLDNVIVMIPFCRTPEEGDRVLEVMAGNGLSRGENGLQVYVMIEIPSNVELAGELSELYDEQNPAVKRMVSRLIDAAHRHETKVGICGQAPSDHPDFAAFLVREGIDSMSLNPDSVIEVIKRVARVESELER
ncbi:MAG: phosphoenolpyruvate synthase [Spirochaetota bacterium]